MSVVIEYGDFAPSAKNSFVALATDKTDFSDERLLSRYGVTFPNYANPCELYAVPLDSSAVDLDLNGKFGIWSESVSDEYGQFDTPIMIEFTADKAFSSQGITLTFDTDNNIHPRNLNIQWYNGSTLLADEDFQPDSAKYFCEQQVYNYDKLILTISDINMPNNRLKLRAIDYGKGYYFDGEKLKSVNLIQELNPISAEISINTMDFTLDAEGDFNFKKKQILTAYFNEELLSVTFVTTAKRTGATTYTVNSDDYIGIMDSIPFKGGMYTNASAEILIQDVFEVANVPYEISDDFAETTVTGYIPYTTCREALMQIAFAIGAVVDTSKSPAVKVFKLSDAVSQTIGLERVAQGQTIEESSQITAVELTGHTYLPITEEIEAFNAEESGEGDNIFVKFTEPLHDLYIMYGEIIESDANYAIISTENALCQLTGQRFDHQTFVKRIDIPDVESTEIKNVTSIAEATLISAQNIDEILENCYNYLAKTHSISADIYERKMEAESGQGYIYDAQTAVGDKITIATEYLGDFTGTIEQQTFDLNGGILLKKSVIK